MGGQVMGTPIFGTQYVLDFTPEGEEHPNVIDRFVKQEHFCDTHCVWTNHHSDCALAQPEQLVVGGDDLPTLTKWTPQRKPLTEEEIENLGPLSFTWRDMVQFARAIEKAHGIGGEHE